MNSIINDDLLYQEINHTLWWYSPITIWQIRDASHMIRTLHVWESNNHMWVYIFTHLTKHLWFLHVSVSHIWPHTYYPVLPACESRLILKSNATIATVARKPIIHHVINNTCWIFVARPMPCEITFLDLKELTCNKVMNLTSYAFLLHPCFSYICKSHPVCLTWFLYP